MKDNATKPKPSINQPQSINVFDLLGTMLAPSPKDDKINFIPKP